MCIRDREYRAVWLTYLEYQQMDLSSEENFRAAIATAFDQIAALGANTVIAHLRPFSDAMYRSELFLSLIHICIRKNTGRCMSMKRTKCRSAFTLCPDLKRMGAS